MKNKIMELADDLARAAFNDQMRQEEARAALQAEVSRVEQEHIQRMQRIEQKVEVLIAERNVAISALEVAKAEADRVESLAETLKIEAQSHAQEARTANATIAAIYQACTGATGEPGNWHGAQPVIDKIAAMQVEIEAAKAEVERLTLMVKMLENLRSVADSKDVADLLKSNAQELAGTEAVTKAAALEIVSLHAELEAAKADAERMNHLVANVRCAGANIDGQHTWNFLWGKGWTTGASFREAVDNAKKGQPK